MAAYHIGLAVGLLIGLGVMIELAADRDEMRLRAEVAKWRGMYRQNWSEKPTEKA